MVLNPFVVLFFGFSIATINIVSGRKLLQNKTSPGHGADNLAAMRMTDPLNGHNHDIKESLEENPGGVFGGDNPLIGNNGDNTNSNYNNGNTNGNRRCIGNCVSIGNNSNNRIGNGNDDGNSNGSTNSNGNGSGMGGDSPDNSNGGGSEMSMGFGMNIGPNNRMKMGFGIGVHN